LDIQGIKKSIKNGTFLISTYHHLNKRIYTKKESDELIGLYIRLICFEKIKRKYSKILTHHKPSDPATQECSKYIWFCWLQGIDNAPPLVKKCHEKLVTHFPDRETILITQENYQNYISIPDWFKAKWQAGIIDHTKLSNLIRLELLINYGGLWIDSTVLSTSKEVPSYIFDVPLFMYSECALGEIRSAATWLISSCRNNNILRATKDVYLAYWKENDELIEYFLITFCLKLAIEKYPEEWDRMAKIPAINQLMLAKKIFDRYDPVYWEQLSQLTPFHKLSIKDTNESELENRSLDTYYNVIINDQ